MTLLEVRLGLEWSSGQGKARPIEELLLYIIISSQGRQTGDPLTSELKK